MSISTDRKIRAILFDMDGVLVEAKDWHYEALNDALIYYTNTSISLEDHLSKFDGLPTKVKLNMLGIPEKEQKLINEYKQNVTCNMFNERIKTNDVLVEMLSFFKFKGYKLAVCSNSIRKTVDIAMIKLGIAPYLDFWLSNEDVTNSKPAPDIYLKACFKLGILPEEALVLEDNKNGITAATTAGCHVLEVKHVEDVCYDFVREHLNV